MFDACAEEEAAATEECQFSLLVTAIAEMKVFGPIKSNDFIQEYVEDKTVRGERPTLDDLQTYVEEAHAISLDGSKKVALNYFFKDMVKLYALFFPLAGDDGDVDGFRLRRIDEYELVDVPEVRAEELGSLLAYMVDRRLMENDDFVSVSNDLASLAARWGI